MSSTMTATYFPEDVFRLIKSFTKPKVLCECCADDLENEKKYFSSEGVVMCKSCYKEYKCEGCGASDENNDECVSCGVRVCDQYECSIICECCGHSVCDDCKDDGTMLCPTCYEEENGTSDDEDE